MLKVLCCAVAVYAAVGVATALAMLAMWAYERTWGAYRHRRGELPTLPELLVVCVLDWPQVVYMLVVTAVGKVSRPRG